jgi:hypothetical protein
MVIPDRPAPQPGWAEAAGLAPALPGATPALPAPPATSHSLRHRRSPAATPAVPAPPPFPGRHASRSPRHASGSRPPHQRFPVPPAVPGATSRSRCHQPSPAPPAVPRRRRRFPGAAGGSRAPPAVPGRHTSRSPRHRCSLAATPAVPRCRQRFPSAASGSPAPPAVPGATSSSPVPPAVPGATSSSPVPPAVPRCRQRFPVPRQPFPRHRHSRRHASPSPRRQRFPAPRQPRPAPGIAAPWCELSKLVV